MSSSQWRNTQRGSSSSNRGSEQPWRSRGWGRGRGRGITFSGPGVGASPSGENISPASKVHSAGTSSEPPNSNATANRMRMNLMASVSRSSGLEKDGDDLKNYNAQEEYRRFIQEKVDNIFENHHRTSLESEYGRRQRIDAQENVLILFRKLREGVASSSRRDTFALEVYETSLYLSVTFESPKQTISIIPHLFPPRSSPSPSLPPSTSTSATCTPLPPPSAHSVLVSLLHHLVVSYPSQSTYFQQLESIPQTILPRTSEVAKWLTVLTKSLRMRNYAKFLSLSRRSCVISVLEEGSAGDPRGSDIRKTDIEAGLGNLSLSSTMPILASKSDLEQGRQAVLFLLEALRKKSAETAWTIIRSAYRELSCDQSTVGMGTKAWLARSLCLEPVLHLSGSRESPSAEVDVDVESWLEARVPVGHVRRKEGVEDRWIVCKVR